MQDWFNRIGLVLQFISLWLVTPQIIGDERMREFGRDWNDRMKLLHEWIRRRFTILAYIVLSLSRPFALLR